MYPIVLVYGLYCLLYEPQRSWLSWALSTLSKGAWIGNINTNRPVYCFPLAQSQSLVDAFL
jgi:hypothetical protein